MSNVAHNAPEPQADHFGLNCGLSVVRLPQPGNWLASEPHHYIDKLTTWLSRALTPGQLRRLRRLCKHMHVCDGPMDRNPQWVMRLQATQPSLEYLRALQQIEANQSIWINYVELARDECCTSREALLSLYRFRRTHEIRLWHPKNQPGFAYEDEVGTTYDARQRKPRQLARYKEQFCRITGELDCLHSEFRLRGHRSVKRAGIECIQDLIEFNHQQWWQTKTKLVALDLERLGRRYRNVQNKTKFRHGAVKVSRCGRFRFNIDRRLGFLLWVVVGAMKRSMQGVVDCFRGTEWLDAALVRVLEPRACQ